MLHEMINLWGGEMGSFCLALVSQSPWICWLAGRRWGGGLCRNGVAIGGGKKRLWILEVNQEEGEALGMVWFSRQLFHNYLMLWESLVKVCVFEVVRLGRCKIAIRCAPAVHHHAIWSGKSYGNPDCGVPPLCGERGQHQHIEPPRAQTAHGGRTS